MTKERLVHKGKAPVGRIYYMDAIVIVVAITVSLIFIILAVLSYSSVISQEIGTPIDFVTFAILGGTGIYGGYSLARYKKIQKIEKHFPDFVRDLAESKKSGMTFTKAILLASKGNYGELTPEIRKMARQISWGKSVNESLEDFAKRLNTPLINRTVSLIIEASRGGGSVADILEAAAKDAAEIKFLQNERKSSMSTYIIIVYIGAFSFLAIVAILCSSLLPSLVEGSKSMPGVSTMVSIEDIKNVFFYGALMQALGSGIVAGVFEDGRIKSGAKHMCILTTITWLVFKLLIGRI